MSQISQIKKIYHAAIYVRLSKEDGAVASHEKAESNSIANQKSLIREFLKSKNDIVIEQEYVDDGFSGSNFERPAFQMMLEDIKKGKIDCVVTKDLSRFGREYIDSGMYIERLFPAMGVRFIAINDGIDSGEAKSQSDEIIIPFKNLINDAYCRDISIKIRSHLEIKRKQGDVITAFVAYGYKKNEKDKHKLEICITKISTFLILCDLAVCLATLYVSFSLVFALMRYLQGKVFLIRFYSPTTLSSSRAEFRLPSRLACA